MGRQLEQFSVGFRWLRNSGTLRLEAGYYNPRVARAIDALKRSGIPIKTLGEVTERIFMAPRFKRIYVKPEHGTPFLQGSHIAHFLPNDPKFLSNTAQKGLSRWVIHENWILVTRSGTIDRCPLVPKAWDGWTASEDILRIVPLAGGVYRPDFYMPI